MGLGGGNTAPSTQVVQTNPNAGMTPQMQNMQNQMAAMGGDILGNYDQQNHENTLGQSLPQFQYSGMQIPLFSPNQNPFLNSVGVNNGPGAWGGGQQIGSVSPGGAPSAPGGAPSAPAAVPAASAPANTSGMYTVGQAAPSWYQPGMDEATIAAMNRQTAYGGPR